MAEAASVPAGRTDRLAGARRARAASSPARRCSSTPAPAASAPTPSSWPSTSARPSPPPPAPATSIGCASSAPTSSSTTRPSSSTSCSSGYDVVLDSQGGDTLARSLRVLKPGGLAIGIAGPPDPDFARRQGLALPLRLAIARPQLEDPPRRQAPRRPLLVPVHAPKRRAAARDRHARSTPDVLRPIIDRTYPFAETPDALAYVEGGRSKGKVVIARVSP